MSARTLVNLEESASSARVLNLRRIARMHGHDRDHAAAPFFQNPLLNRSLVLKHRLRRHELPLFPGGRQTVTKIIIPLDGSDLSLGGWSVLVGQTNFVAIMEGMFGKPTEADRLMLLIIDELPSLDPFLLREHLKRHDRFPARVYFEISDADTARMTGFVEEEISRLINICYGASSNGRSNHDGTAILVKKILSITVDSDTEPLRKTLRLSPQEYQDGIFCWKGFLYYKWNLTEMLPALRTTVDSIENMKLPGRNTPEIKRFYELARRSLRKSIAKAVSESNQALGVYDAAFTDLISGAPQAFRDFLLNAPVMFNDLGDRLGAVSHIVSFWNFRFPPGQKAAVTADELLEIFKDFAGSLPARP